MFCTSLRKRPEWQSVPSTLLSSRDLKFQESSLNTHDISIPLFKSGKQDGFMRLILLSASDMQASEDAVKRVERLSLFSGGQHVGIIFLLQEKNDMKDGFHAYIQLQATLLTSGLEVSIIPLHSLLSLPATISTYHRQTLKAKTTAVAAKPLGVLAYCSLTGHQLREHTVNVLSDVCHGFRELAEAATMTDGQRAIKDWVEDKAQAEEAIGFWLEEYIAE